MTKANGTENDKAADVVEYDCLRKAGSLQNVALIFSISRSRGRPPSPSRVGSGRKTATDLSA